MHYVYTLLYSRPLGNIGFRVKKYINKLINIAVGKAIFLKVYYLTFFTFNVAKLYFQKSRSFSKFTISYIFTRFNNYLISDLND